MSLRFGSLSVPPARVVGTIAEPATLAGFATRDDHPCDIVEVRLDQLGWETNDWLFQSKAIEAAGTPVILTMRSAAEGGRWRRPEAERTAYYTQALDYLAAIDVEGQSELVPKLARRARLQNKTLIVSVHDFTKTPSLQSLRDTIMQAARDATIVKLATLIVKPADVETLARLLTEDWGVPLCVLGMGPLSGPTRTKFPRQGSCLTYGWLDKPMAPNQPAAAELMAALRPEGE